MREINMPRKNIAEEKQKLLNISCSEEKYSRRVKIRAMAVNMYLNSIPKEIIAKTLHICDKTVGKYIHIYEKWGVIGLIRENPNRPKSILEDYAEEIIESLENEPCATINECRDRIQKITGIKRSPTQVAHFIKKKV